MTAPAEAGRQRYGPASGTPIERPVILNRWESLTFMHWRYRPEVVQRLLPAGLTVDTFDGSAWMALVPFVLRFSLPGIPELPWASRFAETNVRTYVRSADGSHGTYVLSLDERVAAAGLPAPAGPPLVHYSPAVDVRIGRPQRVSAPEEHRNRMRR